MGSSYRVVQAKDEQDHQFHCDPCGELPYALLPLPAAKARARRHAAANPTHEGWMANNVMTHFHARERAA